MTSQPVNQHASLRLEALSCGRGERALITGLDLSVAPGEAVQLAGGNGRGKTTLLRTISGLQRPRGGRVLWCGRDVHDHDTDTAGVPLYLAHENALNPDLTPRENLAALVRLHGGRSQVVDAALEAFGMRAHAHRLCRRLSAGQRRRVALARLHLADSRLWLLDEPAAALDADGRAVLAARIAAHAGDGGIVVFTTHEPLALPGLDTRTIPL